MLMAPFFIGAGHRMLEAGGVGGVAGDGYIHVFMAHDGHAFVYIIRTVAAHVGPFALAEGLRGNNGKLIGKLVISGFAEGETVDPADDISRILAKTIQDDLKRILAYLVGRTGDADSTLRGGKAFMASQEGEACGFLPQEHGP
ncbi:hypothetical protein SDC9_180903 [bioreactor metagenome]|uniref:Uncharacterized protein n=1 Tax=bioreactor metagenome TaxID=1076179 RepID=A0A645H4L0_9ZZZZ